MEPVSLSQLRQNLRVNHPPNLLFMRQEQVKYDDHRHNLQHRLANGHFFPVYSVLAREIDPQSEFDISCHLIDQYGAIHYKLLGQSLLSDVSVLTKSNTVQDQQFSVGADGPVRIEGSLFRSVHHPDRIVHFFTVDGLQSFRIPVQASDTVSIACSDLACDLLEVFI